MTLFLPLIFGKITSTVHIANTYLHDILLHYVDPRLRQFIDELRTANPISTHHASVSSHSLFGFLKRRSVLFYDAVDLLSHDQSNAKMTSLFRSPNDPSSSGIDSSDTDHVAGESNKPSATPAAEQSSGINTEPSSSRLPGPLTRVLSSPSLETPNVTGSHFRGLLYTSFLYDICRTEALQSLNQRRDPANQLSKDDEEVFNLSEQMFSRLPLGVTENVEVPAGVMTGPHSAQIRTEYLKTFSKVVNNLAATTLDTIEPLKAPRDTIFDAATLNPTGLNSRLEGASPSFAMQRQLGFHNEAAPGLRTFGKSQASFAGPKSQYASEYQELELLGKGGYGKVYKVRQHLDNQEYAIKKILITSQRLQKFLVIDHVEALLEEVRTLAKLNHTNVVRYFHCWVESAPPGPRPLTPVPGRIDALETIPSQIETSEDQVSRISDRIQSEDVVSDISDRIMTNEFSRHMEYGENQSMAHMLEEAQDREDYHDYVVFAPTSRSGQSPVRNRRASHATTSSIRTLQTSMLSVGEQEDEEIETIPRKPLINEHTSVSRTDRSSLKAPASQKAQSEAEYQGTDFILCIKMSLYPTTLSAYLFKDQHLSSSERGIHHCFHNDASICMLSCLLDGVEYLHSQKIIHRDLKPANIFLSIHHSMPPSLQGCFNMMACSECDHVDKDKRVYITPCIGDFGLIAEMESGTTESISSPVLFLQPKPVGTHFYRPASMPKSNPSICPKLDVYSLGVIAFELAHKFDTKSERAILLTNLNNGALPKNFENHEMAEGIKAMVNEDRDKRWDCIAIREWFFGLQRELK